MNNFPEIYSGLDKSEISAMLWGRRPDLAWSVSLKKKMNRTRPLGGWVKNSRHRIHFRNFKVKDTATCEMYNVETDQWRVVNRMMGARRSAISGVLLFEENNVTSEAFFVIGGEKSCSSCIWPGQARQLYQSVEVLSFTSGERHRNFNLIQSEI